MFVFMLACSRNCYTKRKKEFKNVVLICVIDFDIWSLSRKRKGCTLDVYQLQHSGTAEIKEN